MWPNTALLKKLGGEIMNKVDMEDTLRIITDYVELMLCIHERYEPSITKEEITQYKIGIQTFLLKIKEELDTLKKE